MIKEYENYAEDENGNRNYFSYFGSKEKAVEALKTLIDCSYCSNCSGFKKDLKIPKIENIHQKILEATSKKYALNMKIWHTCETTHCRAGWVVHLAGKEGYELEKLLDTPLAASLIYRESSQIKVKINEFYKTNNEAMKNIIECARLEREMSK